MLLSVSLDKQVKVTSLLSGNPVISYMSSRPAWSCAWDFDNENVFYVGLDGGLIHAYDTRVPQSNPPNATDEYVKALPKMSMAPVISLNHVGSSNDSATVKGILAGHMDGKCVFYEEKPDPSQNDPQQQQQQNPRVDGPRALTYEPHILPLDGTLISLSVEPSTLEFLATFRPNSKYPRVRHVYGKLGRASPDSSRITCLGIKVRGGINIWTHYMIYRPTIYLEPISIRDKTRSMCNAERLLVVDLAFFYEFRVSRASPLFTCLLSSRRWSKEVLLKRPSPSRRWSLGPFTPLPHPTIHR